MFTACAFALGAALAMSFLVSMWGGASPAALLKLAAVAAVSTSLWLGSALTGTASSGLRWLGRVCWTITCGLYALWLYLAITFGSLLGWTVPGWLLTLVGAATVAAVATLARPRGRLRVPFALPLGIWILAALSGWLREENLLRCDDLLALQSPVQLVVPSHPDLASCQAGEVRPSGRFPRTVWQSADGARVVFTTQGLAIEGGIDGSVCEAYLAGRRAPRCVGPPRNKSQGLIELADRDRLLVMQWGLETPSGTAGAAVFELPRSAEIEILATHWFEEMVGDGFYEPRNSTLYMFSDRMNGIHRATLPDFERAPTLPPERFAPGELHYDPVAGEGVACGSPLGAAIRGEPFSLRKFAADSSSPLDKLSVTWGCDWDQAARKVYVTIPNLGLLARVDYDSGRVEQRWFVGFGRRSVAYDRQRGRVYFTDFLRGEVLAFDPTTGRTEERWFVGRFSRWVRLTRDRQSLLATSNLGIVRIPLDGERRASR